MLRARALRRVVGPARPAVIFFFARRLRAEQHQPFAAAQAVGGADPPHGFCEPRRRLGQRRQQLAVFAKIGFHFFEPVLPQQQRGVAAGDNQRRGPKRVFQAQSFREGAHRVQRHGDRQRQPQRDAVHRGRRIDKDHLGHREKPQPRADEQKRDARQIGAGRRVVAAHGGAGQRGERQRDRQQQIAANPDARGEVLRHVLRVLAERPVAVKRGDVLDVRTDGDGLLLIRGEQVVEGADERAVQQADLHDVRGETERAGQRDEEIGRAVAARAGEQKPEDDEIRLQLEDHCAGALPKRAEKGQRQARGALRARVQRQPQQLQRLMRHAERVFVKSVRPHPEERIQHRRQDHQQREDAVFQQ